MIQPDPDQPHTEWDTAEAKQDLELLAESLRTRGQLQPIRVRWDEGSGVYMIQVGERQWRAAGLAGLPTLNCVIDERQLTPDELLKD